MRMSQIKKLVLFAIILLILLYLSQVFQLRNSQVRQHNGWKKHVTNLKDKAKNDNSKLPVEPVEKEDDEAQRVVTKAEDLSLENEMAIFLRKDMDFENKMEKVLDLRQKRMKEQCYRHNLTGSITEYGDIANSAIARQIFVFDKQKVLFCSTGDAFSEMWKKIFATTPLRSLNSYRDESISYRLRFYYKFLVVQQPLVRFLAAYKSNLLPRHNQETENEKKLQKLSSEIRLEYDPENAYNREPNATRYARLVDFASFVVKSAEAKKSMNSLWERIHLLCQPCALQYDYISRAKTAQEDAKYIYSNLKHDPDGKFTTVPMESSDAESMEELRKELPKSIQDDLYNAYRLDHELFGYKKPWD